MHWRFSRVPSLAVGLTLALLTPAAFAVIQALTPLQALLTDSTYIVVGKVEKLHPEKPAVILTVADDLKGKAPFRRLPINFKGDAEAEKEKQVPVLLKRLAVDHRVVLFVNQRGKRLTTFAFTNGTWFQVVGVQTGGPADVAWSLTHGEPYLRRTFKGNTEELIGILRDSLAGKRKPPEPNEKEAPGYGPEAVPTTGARGTGGPLFGVIPTLGIGGPLAILALLFPALFGGVLVLFRQWTAFLTVLSVNSTLLLLRGLLPLAVGPATLRAPTLAWLYDDGTLWTVMTAVTAAGVLWGWRRQLTALGFTSAPVDVPRRTELTVLAILSVTCLVMVGAMFAIDQPSLADPAWGLTVALALGVVAATVYRLVRPTGGLTLPLTTEGAMLGVALLVHIAIAGLRWGGATSPAEGVIMDAPAVASMAAGPSVPTPIGKRWVFPVKDSGLFVASACVDGDRVYAAAAHPTFKAGTLYCLDRRTGKKVWDFIDDGELKQMISSPTVADGRVFIGEGFHDDQNCKLYCVDAATGEKRWAFQTTSQTESSPKVANGRVYFGGGNDGFYCVDAAAGTKVWQFTAEKGGRLLRFGAAPAVVDGRVYAGTGVDRNRPDDPGETAVVCLDADTGKLVWKAPTPLPCWGAPVVWGGHVYVGLGNGDVFTDAAKPAGRVVCLDAKTGNVVWHRDLPNGVLEAPAVDGGQVYVGCRDGHVYALGLHDGKERWKTPLGSAVIASPALAACPGYDATAHVFAASTGGKVVCLHPATGAVVWNYPVAAGEKTHLSSSPRVTVSRTPDGDRRHLIFGVGLGELAGGRAVLYCLEDLVKVQ